jgi:lipopolysaccharide export system permease protein
MLMSRTNRYIIKEILTPTLICLLVFTMVLLVGRLMKLVDLVVNKGVSLGEIFILFGTMLPTFLNITLPLAFLMGIMIGLSRMSADSETVALKAAGIGLGQIARPIIALAIVFSMLTGVAAIWLKPWGYRAFRNQVFAITMQKATIGFQKQVFMKQFDNLTLYADDIDGRSGLMSGLFIVEKKPESSMVIFADQGNILTDEAAENISIQLNDGTIHRQQKGTDSAYQLIHFQNYNVQPNFGETGKQNGG